MFLLLNFFLIALLAVITVFCYLSNDLSYLLFGFITIVFFIGTIRRIISSNIYRMKEDKELKEVDSYEKFLNDNGFEFVENPDNKMYEKELELCAEYLEKNPTNEYAYRCKGTIYYNLEKYNEAMEIYKTILDKHKNEFFYVLDYAKCFYALNDKPKALQIMNSFFINEEKDSSYYSRLSDMYCGFKEYNRALENINRAIELAPDELFILYYKRALIYKILNRLVEYEADMKKYDEFSEEFNKKYGIKTDNNVENSKKDKDDFKNLKP